MRFSLSIVIAVLVMGAAGCDSEFSGAGIPPCDRYDADPLCGTDCVLDNDCGPDLYCNVDGVCTGDCDGTGEQCPDGQICAGHGRCIADPGDAGTGDSTFPDVPGCGTVTVDLAPVIPTVLLLIDQSGSMTSSFGSVDRWEAVTTALVADPDGVVTQLQDRVIFGATLYTSNGGYAGGDCPVLTSVPPELNNLGNIEPLLTGNAPAGDTPTGESIGAVAAELLAMPDPPDGPASPKVIVVATDGEPDTCDVPNPQEGQPESVAAAQAAFAAGVRLFILSVGSGVSDAHLQDMANAGVGLPVGGGTDAPFYVANSQNELVDAFYEIIFGIRSCELQVDGIVDLEQADQGHVELNSVDLVYGQDWDMQDASTLVLLGEACDTFLSDEEVTLLANFPCGAIVQ
ncbi:MAG: vWA domain-containing protein [bacterium]